MQRTETQPLSYVLITPARDEAKYIRKTLEAMVHQTVRPLKWVIVSDGSTDGTDEIVKEYAARHDWIELLRMPERKERNFGGKVHAFNAGQERVKRLAYDVIGNLDGDSSFEPDYLECLLGKFAANPRLGIGGTDYVEESWDAPLSQNRFSNIEDVTGQCQLFRRECFAAIGGYAPRTHGGVDLFANLSARMHGWETRVYTDRILFHHRQQGTAQCSKLTVEFANGGKDYMFGSHPLWEICRAVYRLTKVPYVVGGCLLFAGYFWAMLTGRKKTVGSDIVEFRRKEQMDRLGKIFRNQLVLVSTLRSLVTRNYFTFPLYVPRIIYMWRNWAEYLYNYFTRTRKPTEYRLRNGIRLMDSTGTLTGTMAVVFIRREYGTLGQFETIVEIGAHIGCFTSYAAKSCPEAKLYCYEPEQRNFSQLKQNVAINGLEGRVSVHNCAVASQSGMRELAVCKSLLNSFHIVPTDSAHQTVKCTTLREILVDRRLETVDMLKLNCEGAEYEILESCSDADFERIARIRLEYHDLDALRRNGKALARFLKERGYEIERFTRYRYSFGFIWAARPNFEKPTPLLRGTCRYVLITPARDEAAHIRITLESMIVQTVRPLKWVIVSDGSTDGTDDIVKEYAVKHDWIELVRMPERKDRHFGGKVHAFNAGHERVKAMGYEVIGNLDGDISFEPDYLEYLLGKLANNPRLGVVGTNYLEDNSMKYDYRFTNIEDVTGQCQLFRRDCFEQIGGYQPNKDGGVDLFATLSARMHGWQTRTFTGKYFVHHRPSGTAKVSKYLVEFYNGRKDYSFGCHPLWETFRATYRLVRKPWIIGGSLLFIGYYWAMLNQRPKSVSDELIRFRKKEQMFRLRRLVWSVAGCILQVEG